MSGVEQITPVLLEPQPEAPRNRRRRYMRHALWTGSGLAVLHLAAVAGLIWWASSSSFENLVRRRLIARIEQATGGRAEIASLHWKLFKLEAEANGVVIHGLESPNEAPYAQLESLHVQLSVLGFWSPRIVVRSLEATRPQFHLIVYPDGSTNQPEPRRKSAADLHPLGAFFDLKAGRVNVTGGVLDYDNRADTEIDFQDRQIPLDFAANDVSLRLAYIARDGKNPESYRVETAARDLRLVRGPSSRPVAQPVEGFMQGTLDLTRNAAWLRSLRLTAHTKGAPDRVLDISGRLDNFNHPRWQATAKGELDFRLMEPVLGYPFTPNGIARVDLSGQGQGGLFRIDGTVHADGASYIGTGVNAHGVGLDAKVHADPQNLRITSVVVRLQQGGQLEGDVLLDHWISPLPGAPVVQAASPTQKAPNNARTQSRTPAPQPHPNPVPPDLHTNGKVNALFKDVSLDTLLDLVSLPPYQRLGIDTRLNGLSTAIWNNGDDRTLSVTANFGLSATGRYVSGEAPATGAIDAIYTHRDGEVDLRRFEVNLPGSQVEAHGHLGAYPISSPTGIAIAFHSHDLGEFNTLFGDLGLKRNGRTGTAALPVLLAGQADFQGNWTGSLADPHLTGTLQATNLTVEIPSSVGATQPQLVHWDSLEATGAYSAARIAIDRSKFRHGDASINLDGVLTAASGASAPGRPHFDSNSLLHARLRASGVNVDDLQPFLTQHLPLTGVLSAQIDGDGPIAALDGNGWVQIDKGTLYDEPVTSMRVQGKIAGQVVHVASLTLSNAAGNVTGSGAYDLRSRQFQLEAKSNALDIGKIKRLRDASPQVTGSLAFSISSTGTLDDPRLEARATLAKFAVGGEPVGDVNVQAHTANHSLIYDVETHLEAAELTAHGQTALNADRDTQATLNFSRFNVGALLKLAHVTSLTGESALAGTVTLQGPLARPEALHGEARLNEMAMTIAGVHLRSEGGVHATLADSRISLDPVHIIGDQTDVHFRGSLSLKERRQLDLAAKGAVNLKLAETIDPDLTASGTTTFTVEAHGPLQNPDFSGRVDFENASLALEDLPNSLSQLHGTLEFNRDRLEVKSLTAMSGGGLLSVSGYLAYRNGLYADLSLKGNSIRIRYPQGVSSAADLALQLQGPQNNLLLSGSVMITRFTVNPQMDFVALASQATKSKPVPPANAPSNHVRLDVRIQSAPQLNFQNAYAKLAGDVDLRLRGTIASPSLLGRVSITEGTATIAGTRYELQRGEITFTNPVRIQPLVDLNATARVEDYDITLGLHGSFEQMNISYRSDPPLPEADVVALLALGRTQDQQRLYTQQQQQLASNPTTDALLGGALNATVSSRVQRLFGAGSVKVDPSHLGMLGNSTTRITVEEQLGKNLTLTYATNADTSARQLLQAEIAINRHISVLVSRDESGVFSMVVKATRRFR